MQPTIAETLLPRGGSESTPCLRKIDTYEVLALLGEGGMGVVYLCNDTKLRRPVALKMMRVGRGASDDELHRFRQEAESLSNFQHPHIVQVFDLGIHDDQPYLVMEYLDGGDLASRLQGRPLTAAVATKLMETLARAVQAAHEENIVHRDLKPANVLIVEKPPTPLDQCTLKVTDFGLAKRLADGSARTVTGIIMGTPEYMAPEQASGKNKEIGPTADVYALGAILYEMLTGRPPFRGATTLETLEQVRSVEPTSPSRLVPRLPRDLCTIVLKCLHKDPERRYATAGELADDLQRYRLGQPIVARPVGTLEKLLRTLRRHPLASALITASVVLALLALWLLWQLQLTSLQQRLEEQNKQALEAEKDFAREQHRHAVEALSKILAKLHGPLRSQPGLEPIREELLIHFKQLIEDHETHALGDRQILADACLDLGKLLMLTGDPERARKSLEEARKLYQANGDALQEARALLELGRVYLNTGAVAKARQHFDRVQDRLRDHSHPSALALRADAWHFLGEAALNANELSEAKSAFYHSRDLWRVLDEKSPTREVQRKRARSHGYLGDVYFRLGDPLAADREYHASHQWRLKLANGPDDGEQELDWFQLARSWGNFARMQTYFRMHRTAQQFYQKGLEIQEKLVANQPRVTDYLTDLANSYHAMAELELLGEPSEEARARVEEWLTKAQAHLKYANASLVEVRQGQIENHLLWARWLLPRDRSAARQACQLAQHLLPDDTSRGLRVQMIYQRAALHGLQAQLAEPGDPETARRMKARALEDLKHLQAKGYPRLSWADIRRDQAFALFAEEVPQPPASGAIEASKNSG
jgi:serine/threonine protein kinase